MNISIYIALVSLWRHSSKEKNQEDARTMRALELAQQNNLLTIAFPQMEYLVFPLLCAGQ